MSEGRASSELGAWTLEVGGREGASIRTQWHARYTYVSILLSNGINSLLLAKRARGKAFRMHGDLATVPTSICPEPLNPARLLLY